MHSPQTDAPTEPTDASRPFNTTGGPGAVETRPRPSRLQHPPRARARSGRSRLGEALVRLYREDRTGVARAPSAIAPRPAVPTTDEEPSGRKSERLSRKETDRRAFPRRDSGCVVSVCHRKGDSPINQQRMAWMLHASRTKGTLVDISMNGVAFLMETADEPIEPDDRVLLRITNRRFDRHVDTTGRVVRASADETGGWRVVCRFDKQLAFDEVSTLGRHLFQSNLV